jgi:hypothetical protein
MSLTVAAPRALSVASIHLGPINESRRRAGLAPLTAAEVEHEFADVNRSPVRTKGVVPSAWSNQAANTMWGGIVAHLNMTVRAKPGLSSGRVASPAASPGSSSNRSVDWGEISRGLNEQAGLASPARRAR